MKKAIYIIFASVIALISCLNKHDKVFHSASSYYDGDTIEALKFIKSIDFDSGEEISNLDSLLNCVFKFSLDTGPIYFKVIDTLRHEALSGDPDAPMNLLRFLGQIEKIDESQISNLKSLAISRNSEIAVGDIAIQNYKTHPDFVLNFLRDWEKANSALASYMLGNYYLYGWLDPLKKENYNATSMDSALAKHHYLRGAINGDMYSKYHHEMLNEGYLNEYSFVFYRAYFESVCDVYYLQMIAENFRF